MILPVMLLGLAPSDDPDVYGYLTPEELARLERQAARWLLELEERQRPLARPLTAAEKAALAGHFTAELLDRARLREVDGIDNPEFYAEFFSGRGKPLPIDFRQASGLALVDTILVVSRRVPPRSAGWLPLLFHELVHLAQVEAQGRDEHVAHYVRGWAASGFEYRSIPQEAQAYELAARFRAAPAGPFSVEAEVAERFGTKSGEAGDETASGRQP
ncbi:MAG: hypothetical protein ACE5EG_11550 [Thermoanaerobaculia bacterium]